MEEFLFRVENALESLQVQLRMASENGLRIVRQYSDEGRNLAIGAFNDHNLSGVQNALRTVWQNLLHFSGRIKSAALETLDTTFLTEQFTILFRDEIYRNNAYFVLVGLGFGTTGGFLLGLWLARPHITSPIMKAVAFISLDETNRVGMCNTNVPIMTNPTDILVRVRAASLDRLDYRIVNGYGRFLRNIIHKYDSNKPEFPLVIGRSCAGIVEAVGKDSVSGLEIGDEVWLASPWHEPGLASDLVVAPDTRVGRKPYLIGFEGAASLPYSGCTAIGALERSDINEFNCTGKRVLIQDGCSPVGCVLTQLLKHWGAIVTSTCHSRSAPVVKALGCDDIISFSNENFKENFIDINIEKSNFMNELASREQYDYIFLTSNLDFDKKFLKRFISENGKIIDTLEEDIFSDDLGSIGKFFYTIYIRLKYFTSLLLRTKPDWGGPHLCHLVLDRLALYVNDEILKTVVDQVYNPHETEQAITHICSEKRIGSTVLTFR